MNPFWLSVEVASLALINIMLSGLLLNYIVKRYQFVGKSLIDSVVTLPLVLPPVVVGFGILMALSPGYALGAFLESQGLGIVFTKWGAVIASSIIGFPLFYQSVRSALSSINSDVEDVARTLGASEMRIFWTISLPLAWRGVLSGAILSFTRALGEFGATILVAGNIPKVTQTMPLAIYSYVEIGDYGGAFEIVLWICALTLGLLWTIHFLGKGNLFNGSK